MEIVRQQRRGVPFYACPGPAWTGSSPRLAPRFRLSMGAEETPPSRVEKPWAAPVQAGPGQA